MEHVSISDLYPGEIILVTERVAKYRDALTADGEVPPVDVHLSGDRLVVRNGHNRIRALIEHRLTRKEDIGSVPALIGTGAPPRPETHIRWQQVAVRYGCGADAFLALPVVPEAEYYRRHGEIEREIIEYAKTNDHTGF